MARRATALLRGTAPAGPVLAVAAALLAGVFALRFAIEGAGEAVGILFVLPVALLAVRFGVRAGLVAAALALALVAVWVVGHGVSVGVAGWISRAVVLLLTGGALGWYAERLRSAEAAQRRLVREAPDGVLDLDAEGRIVELNGEAARLLGTDRGPAAGRAIESFLPAALLAHRDALRFLAAPAFRSLQDVELVRPDGERVVIDATVMPRASVRGAVVRVLLRDVSERERERDALRHTAALLSAAEEVAGMGAWEWDLHGARQRWSPQLYALLGLDPDRVEPTFDAFLAAVHPDDRERVAAAGRRALEEGAGSAVEFRIVRPDGEVRVVEGVGRAIRDSAGRTGSIIGTTRDVSEHKRAEAHLAAATAERARADQTRQLLQITDAALASLPLDDLLAEVLRRVCDALPADAAALLLDEPSSDALSLRATHGIEERLPNPSRRELGLAARIRRERAPVAVAGGEVATVGLTPLRSMGAVAGAPLFVADEIIGVIEVGRRVARRLAPDELALLQLAADRSALAIDHGRVFERERHIARTLQRSLLPARLPDIPGVELHARFLPAGEGQEVGGDFYDVFPVPGGRWLLVVGDVCGKGPEAAALTALARYTLRAEAMHEPSPGVLLGRLNDAIIAQRADMRFCTALCLTLDVAGEEPVLTVASGGHPMPLVVRADGGVDAGLTPGGPLVGVIAEAEYREQRLALGPNDSLVAYTDGLLDAHAPDRVLTPGDLAAAAASAADGPLPALVRALEDAAVGTLPAPVRDDIAILALSLDGARAGTGGHRASGDARPPAPRPADTRGVR